MKTFIFEQYGYYNNINEDNSFEIDNFKFKLIKVDLKEEDFVNMESHLVMIKNTFQNIGPHIIKNKYNKYISFLGDEAYILIAIYLKDMTINDLYTFHKLFFDYQSYIDLSALLLVWKDRMEEIEKNISLFLNNNDFFYLESMEKIMFYLGLATNAMQYVSDIIYDNGDTINGACLSHKRLLSLNSFDFFNPLNFVISSPFKDISMLYHVGIIDENELEPFLKGYNIDTLGAKLLMARILYRSDFFDLLERKGNLHDEAYNIDKELSKIKKAYRLLKIKYQIRPIDWLEN